METINFEDFKTEFLAATSEYNETINTVAVKISTKLDEILPIIKLLQSEYILFTHPDISGSTYKGIILGETSNGSLLIYCGNNKIEIIDKYTGEPNGSMSFHMFARMFNFDHYLNGINHVLSFNKKLEHQTHNLKSIVNRM